MWPLDWLTFSDILIIIVAIAAVGTLQFFKGRKLNLTLMYFSMKTAEKALEPKDKNYTLIGTYVGYTAIYDVEGPVKKVEYTVVLLPRQSLLYFPVSLLTTRFDKVFIRYIMPHKITKEAHLVAKGYYRVGLSRAIKGFENMSKEEVVIGGKKYVLAYTSGSAARKLLSWLKNIENPTNIKHLALVPANRSLYIAAKLDPEQLESLLVKSYQLAKEFAE